MTEVRDLRAPSRQPTPYPALNTVLATLVDRVRDQLGDNFLAAYLHGSFALGDADEGSDVDVLLVTREDIAAADLPALQALHAALFAELPAPWGQRLEASYFPAAILKRWSETPRDPPDAEPRPADWADPGAGGTPPRAYPLLYLDNGASQLVRSEHDNSRVVRWVTRERGIVLAGPDPRELIDEVTPIALRAEVRGTMRSLATRVLNRPGMIDQRWLQAFLVTLFCRMLHTLSIGEVTSKKAATAWALEAFALRWKALIQRALAIRSEPLEARIAPAPRTEVVETVSFIRQVLRQDAPKKPKPKRRSPKPGFTFNALVPGQPTPEAPPKRAPSKRPFSKGPPSRSGPSAGGYAKDPAGKRPPPRDGAARDGASRGPARDGPPKDATFRGPRGPVSKSPYSKGPPKRDGAPRDGASRGPSARDAGPRDSSGKGPSRGPSSFSKGPPRGGPSKGPGGRTFSKGPPGKRPPPKR